jgi:cell division transport system permease protein
MVAGLQTNPLPESFEISLDPLVYEDDNFTLLIEYLSQLPGVEDIGYAPKLISKLKTLFNILTVLGLVMGLLVALATAFIVGNTIHVKISDRRQTFYIMRLVGASPAFIRSPYLLIGALIGLLGTALAISLTKLTQLYFSGFVVPTVFLTAVETICFITAGGLIGFTGSHLALKRYLRL